VRALVPSIRLGAAAEVGELFRTQVCRSTEEILDVQETWKAAMIAKGWSDAGGEDLVKQST
jgi:hypothetical protein